MYKYLYTFVYTYECTCKVHDFFWRTAMTKHPKYVLLLLLSGTRFQLVDCLHMMFWRGATKKQLYSHSSVWFYERSSQCQRVELRYLGSPRHLQEWINSALKRVGSRQHQVVGKGRLQEGIIEALCKNIRDTRILARCQLVYNIQYHLNIS